MTRSIAWCAAALVAASEVMAAQCADGSPEPCRARPATPAMSIAVLTFQSRSRDTNDIFLAEGLADDIAARLDQVGRIVVRSREAVRRLPNADKMSMANLGQELSAAYILSGSVQPAGGRLRVRVELTKAQTSVVAWSNPYDRTRDDILAMQSEIASQVASAVAGRLGVADARRVAAAPTTNAEAFTHLARGTAFLARRMREHAMADLRAAVRLDATSAVAWARLSQALSLCANTTRCGADSLTVVRRQARAAADRAIALDSSLADAWLADGLALVNSDRPDVPAARASLERAVRLDPRNAEAQHVLAFQMLRMGDNTAAKEAYRKALAIDPGRGITFSHLSSLALDESRWADAEALADTALALLPGFADALSHRWFAVVHQDSASRIRDMGTRLSADSVGRLFVEVFALLAERDTVGASAGLDRILKLPGPVGRMATALLGRVGRRNEAGAQVREWTEPTIATWHALRSSTYDGLRGIPEFESYVERARQRAFWTARPK